MSAHGEKPTNQNPIARQCEIVMPKIEELNNIHRSGGQRTSKLEERLLGI